MNVGVLGVELWAKIMRGYIPELKSVDSLFIYDS